MKVLVLAQGDSRRWSRPDGEPRLGKAKHFIEVDAGEPLIDRLQRQLVAHGLAGDQVAIVAPHDGYMRCYAVSSWVRLDDPRPTGHNLDKLYATQHLWDPDGRTVILFGDVFYTDDAIATILDQDHQGPHWYRRPGPSTITGHPWDETFALAFHPADHDRLLELARRVTALAASGRIRGDFLRCLYASHLGLPDHHLDDKRLIADTDDQTIIDDWTDDFDTWDQWCSFMGRYHADRYRVVVAVPWAGGDVERTRAWTYTRHHYEDLLGLEVVTGDDDTPGPAVNRSRARNLAVDAAFRRNPHAVFIADADVIVPGEQLWAAVHLAVLTDQLVLAFETFARASQAQTRRVINRDGTARKLNRSAEDQLLRGALRRANHASCAMAITKPLWRRTGGYDERFTSWGGEDRAFWLTAVALAGAADRITGTAIHLWHPASPEREKGPDRDAMVRLAMRYKRACGYTAPAGILPAHDGTTDVDLDELAAILTEPGAPHGDTTAADLIEDVA